MTQRTFPFYAPLFSGPRGKRSQVGNAFLMDSQNGSRRPSSSSPFITGVAILKSHHHVISPLLFLPFLKKRNCTGLPFSLVLPIKDSSWDKKGKKGRNRPTSDNNWFLISKKSRFRKFFQMHFQLGQGLEREKERKVDLLEFRFVSNEVAWYYSFFAQSTKGMGIRRRQYKKRRWALKMARVVKRRGEMDGNKNTLTEGARGSPPLPNNAGQKSRGESVFISILFFCKPALSSHRAPMKETNFFALPHWTTRGENSLSERAGQLLLLYYSSLAQLFCGVMIIAQWEFFLNSFCRIIVGKNLGISFRTCWEIGRCSFFSERCRPAQTAVIISALLPPPLSSPRGGFFWCMYGKKGDDAPPPSLAIV